MPLELKATINLPKTDFPMKANLPQNEPKMLARWEEMRIYDLVRKSRAGSPMYVLHDGPPYANGPIHLGTAMNKTLKDFVVKSKNMAGFDAPYIPGWDCHGLPIEIKVDEKLGGKKLQMDPMAVRKACRDFAQKFLDLQRSQFKRIGVFGRWEEPYSTMTPQYESVVLSTLFSFITKGAVYKGLASGVLVHPRPHGARRSRSRIRDAQEPEHLGEVQDAVGPRRKSIRRWPARM